MSIDIQMPALSPSMEYGTLAKWLVKEGDLIGIGDVIAEIETDKATMELESDQEGVLSSIVVPAGTEAVVVGHVIATLVSADAASSAEVPATDLARAPLTDVASASVLEPSAAGGSAPVRPAPPAEIAGDVVQASSPAVMTAPAAVSRPAAPVAATSPLAQRMSPLARRLSSMHGIDVSALKGSGPRDRIIKMDLDPFLPRVGPEPDLRPVASSGPASAPAPGPPYGVPFEAIKLTAMRKTIARRLTESKQTIPHFYLSIDLHLDALLALRTQLNAAVETRGVKLSVNDFLIKAVAAALNRVPAANVQYAGDQLYVFARADISVAVAIDGGLVTPVIRDAGARSISDIAVEMKNLAGRAREGRLMPEDYQGGTASLSNLGMFGIRDMVPVINPPQGLILGVGAAERRPVFVDEEVKGVSVLTATGSFDHRAIDGAVAAEFMAALKEVIETPFLLVI